MIKIAGFEKLQNSLDQLEAVVADLNQPFTVPKYDPNDLASVHSAISQIERQIDERAEPYSENQIVIKLVGQLRAQYREKILMTAMAEKARSTCEMINDDDWPVENLRRLENAVSDMQLIDSQSAASHFELLNHILQSGSLREISKKLSSQVNLVQWIDDIRAKEAGMAGSVTPRWPVETEKRLGLVIGLINAFVTEEISLFQFSYTCYYSATNVDVSYRKLVAQMINPFARDYRLYVTRTLGTSMSDKEKSGSSTVNQNFNFNNSNIASLQTGSHSVANVTIQNGLAGTSDLIKALDAVTAALAANSSMAAQEKRELMEMVEDSKQEAAKENPNKSKIRTYLSGIAGAIGTVSDLKSGYDLLVVGASAAGYTLPSF